MSRPRIGFHGVGWIGRSRMQAIADTGEVEIAAVSELSDGAAAAALSIVPDARRVADLDALLALRLDGVVIATPSAQHAAETIAALRAGAAVFCQKPLGRSAEEVAAAVAAARHADRLLAVDLSYRCTGALRAVREAVRGGELGPVHAVDLTFHNAYGPDKPWFFDRELSGGGCVIDLGVHLVDLALWVLDFPEVAGVSADLFAGGRRLEAAEPVVEDFALATLRLVSGTVVRLACSWNLPAGRDAVIEAAFWGATGGAALRNVGGSFFDFEAEATRGANERRVLFDAKEDWGGRAAAAWARRLARDAAFDPAADELVATARVLDAIYGGSLLPD